MQLSELSLNRNLYKTQPQTLETQDANTVASNINPAPSTAVASGNTVIDINTNAMQIDGNNIDPTTLPSVTLDVSNWGWTQTCVFSISGASTVNWTTGIFKSSSGTTYTISSSGTTGIMSGKTYVYLNLNVSSTAYQTTTTSSDSVGVGKVLIALCENGASTATYNLVQASQIVGDNILANTIDASKIKTGQLIVGTNVGIGTAFPSASAGSLAYMSLVGAAQLDTTVIVGGYIKTSLLTADNIIAGTLTGRTVQTSLSGARVVMSGANNDITIYDTNYHRMQLYNQGATFWDASNNYVADIYAGATGSLLITTSNSGSANRNIYIQAGTNGAASLGIGAQSYFLANGNTTENWTYKSIKPTSTSGIDLGDDVYSFGQIFGTFVYMNTIGYVTAAGGTGTPYPAGSFAITHLATGRYSISHVFGSNYTVMITPVAATAKVWVIETKGYNYFVVRIANFAGTLEDNDFMFTLIPYT